MVRSIVRMLPAVSMFIIFSTPQVQVEQKTEWAPLHYCDKLNLSSAKAIVIFLISNPLLLFNDHSKRARLKESDPLEL